MLWGWFPVPHALTVWSDLGRSARQPALSDHPLMFSARLRRLDCPPMNEWKNLRALGAVLGAALGSVLGIVLVMLVVFLTPAFGIKWPVAHSAVLLAALALPVVLTASIGALYGPSIP